MSETKEFNFTTSMDTIEGGLQQYQKGLKIGRGSLEIAVSIFGTWSCIREGFSGEQSYEKLGYHANTHDLFMGFVDSGCRITIYNRDSKKDMVINPKN